MKKFELALESLMKSLDAKSGLKWPHPRDFSFLRDAVFFDESGIISESRQLDIFPKEMFRNTVALLNDFSGDFSIFSQAEFLNTVEGLPKEMPPVNEQVLVLKFNFKLYADTVNVLSRAFGYQASELESSRDVDVFYDRMFDCGAAAAFCPMEDGGKHYSVFLLDKGRFSLNILAHEMIHYMQHVFGRGFIENNRFLKINLRNDTFGLVRQDKLDEIFSRDELLPYIHSICYALEDHGVKTVCQMLDVLGKFLEYDGDPEKYIARCKSLDEYKWFKGEEVPIHMLMLSVIYGRSMRLFKTVMGKYFSSKYSQL